MFRNAFAFFNNFGLSFLIRSFPVLLGFKRLKTV